MRDAVVAAAVFLHAHACDPIRLGDVADHVGYSPFHLTRAFTREIGTSPARALAAHRFHRAKRLLLDGDDRIADICHAVGFSSVGTFTTRFAEAVGTSPTEFRRLPHDLADAPPIPASTPGAVRGGAVVAGSVRIGSSAAVALGTGPLVFVGLYPARSARGQPAVGAMLTGAGDFLLTDAPPGAFWVLATALSTRRDYDGLLVPGESVIGASPIVLHLRPGEQHVCDLPLELVERWRPPVLAALPAMASEIAQDWRRRA
ncbi:helix-turn-helix transcriptional regulator [Amycolatopsis minnesotensis]|uniref:HTH araC/xylS-type domain-containing protein n=1 Tax=Amycolatopsis minnesotensis TaxID=337894 RepID=A0ABN2QFU6_9PSEU